MSLDQRGREAGLATRLAAASSTDAARGLVDLRRRHGRRRATAQASTVAVLLAVVAAAVLLVRGSTATVQPVDPVPTCAASVCRGSGTYAVDLRVPLTWTVPQGWEQHLAGNSVAARPVGSQGRSPLVVLEDVRGGDYASQAKDPGDAASIAEWMRLSPELGVSDVRTTTLAGLPAIHLTVRPTTGYLLFGTKLPIPVDDQLDTAWFVDQPSFDISGYLGKEEVYVATPGERTDVWLLDAAPGTATAVVAPSSDDPQVVEGQQLLLGSLSFRAR